MSTDKYSRSLRYEMFIRRTFNCQKGSRNGAESSYMENAISMEDGETYAKHLGSFEKQFQKVKVYVSKALSKLKKTTPYSKEYELFDKLYSQLDYCSSTNELMDIVDIAFNKLIEIDNN